MGLSPPLSAPVPLSDDHQIESFDSGEPVLEDWLRRRARPNQASGASRTYVVCEGKRVVAFYYIALGFDPCPAESMTLVVTLQDVRATLESS